MKNIALSSATPDQVRNFALMVGCDLLPADGPETVLAKLRRVWNGDGITVAETPDTTGTLATGHVRTAPDDREPGEASEFSRRAGAKTITSADSAEDPRVVLKVQTPRIGNDVSKLQNFVPVGVNGKVFQVMTGVPVDVPYRVYAALNNAVRDEITHDDSGEVQQVTVHAFPFNVEEMPSRAEIAAWKEKTDRLELA